MKEEGRWGWKEWGRERGGFRENEEGREGAGRRGEGLPTKEMP